MADKGFNCQDELAFVGASLVIPTFLDKRCKFPANKQIITRWLLALGSHNWHIFDRKIPITLAPIAVSALSNFHPPLIN